MQGTRLAALCAGLVLTGAAFAEQRAELPQPPAATQPASGHALTAPDVEAFFDGILPLQLERSDIAGASVLVMQGDQVLLEKGYGYVDVKSKKAVDPKSTIFRLASISKLFTWVSVMQLVEQGKLDLDTDINRYLDFQIRPKFGQPITLRNLMTHTGGFEESSNGVIFTNPKLAISLRDFLIQNQPDRLFPPGKIPAYSNYGVGLASYIVQRASGEPFEEYIQKHIFTPLGMTHSSFMQPLPKSLASSVSEGYRGNTTKPAVGFEIFNPVGAGGISSSADDMGRFGQALLHGGELPGESGGQRILKPETLALMWTPQFRASDQLPPLCMGFYQDWRNNLRWIGHGGDLIAFHSMFFVEPTQKILLFVSYNSAGGGDQPRPEIIDMFSDRYFPDHPAPVFLKTPIKELKAIEGTYETTRRADSTKLAPGNLFGQRKVSVDKDGNLHVEDAKDLRGHPIKLKPIGKDLWQDSEGQGRLFAIRDASGAVVRLAGNFPGVQMQRVVWYENSRWVLPALGASIAILALVVLAFLIRVGRLIIFRKRPRWAPQPGTIWLTAGPNLAAHGWVVLLGVMGGFAAIKGNDLMPPTPAWYPWLQVINVATAIVLILSVFAVIAAIRVCRRANLRSITKVKFSLVAIAVFLLSWFAIHWNLIGPAHRI